MNSIQNENGKTGTLPQKPFDEVLQEMQRSIEANHREIQGLKVRADNQHILIDELEQQIDRPVMHIRTITPWKKFLGFVERNAIITAVVGLCVALAADPEDSRKFADVTFPACLVAIVVHYLQED